MNDFIKKINIVILISDLFIINVVFTFIMCFFCGYNVESLWNPNNKSLIVYNIAFIVIYAMRENNTGHRKANIEKVITDAVYMVFYFYLFFYFLYKILLPQGHILVSQHFYMFSADLVFIVASRFYVRRKLKKYRRAGRNNHKVILLGNNTTIYEIYNYLESSVGYIVYGYFADEKLADVPEKLEYLGPLSAVTDYLEKNNIQEVYSCAHSSKGDVLRPIMNYCESNFVYFYFVPSLRRYCQRRMDLIWLNEIPVLSLHEGPLNYFDNRFFKRVFDIVFSLFIIIFLLSWIFPILAVFIKIGSKGPVFFKQERTGLDGKTFTCLKFRSMRVNGEADKVQATPDDPRKTKFGNFIRKTNLDELPQFLNVLKGEMSVVGPRPHMIAHTEQYSALIKTFMLRHYVKPGITGWAQVTGCRGETKHLCDMEERVKKDIWYIENWTMLLDLKIIVMTVKSVFVWDGKAV